MTLFPTELVLTINRKPVDAKKSYDRFLVFSLSLLEITAIQRTFTLEAIIRLGAVNLQHHRVGHEQPLDIIETPEIILDVVDKPTISTAIASQTHIDLHKYLFTVSYRNVSIFFCNFSIGFVDN